MPTTILDGETYEQARHRRFTEEAKVIEKIQQDEIIRMAREAGFEVVDGQLRLYFDGSKALLKPNYIGTVVDGLKEFATIVAAHEREKIPKDFVKACEVLVQEKIDAVLAEREACAKVCEKRSHRNDDMGAICAAAIRARGDHA